MRFEDVEHLVGTVPYVPPFQGKILYDFILEMKPKRILELGFAHGTSTCYMAAALDVLKSGSIVTIDVTEAKSYKPTIIELLAKTGLEQYVTPIFSESSYNWEMKKWIEAQSRNPEAFPLFDFCFIDGLHEWQTDGLAFFLIEKLLAPGGWILFDDLDWSYAEFSGPENTLWPASMPDDYQTECHVDTVFSLLVMQHPSFENFQRNGSWGWAQKKSTIPSNTSALLESVYLKQSIVTESIQLAKRIYRRLFRRSRIHRRAARRK